MWKSLPYQQVYLISKIRTLEFKLLSYISVLYLHMFVESRHKIVPIDNV